MCVVELIAVDGLNDRTMCVCERYRHPRSGIPTMPFLFAIKDTTRTQHGKL